MVLENFVIQANMLLDIGIIIVIATLISYLIKALKQPLIPAYILTGILIGPFVLKLITNIEEIKILAELGIAFLLFMVGLEIDFKKLKDVSSSSTITGLIQVSLFFIVGFLLAIIFGFIGIEAVYLGIILAFSSTMVVIKLLSDRHEIGTLHGRIILGILVLQDILAVLALSMLSMGSFSFIFLILAIVKGVGLFLITFLISKFILPYVFRYAARSQELLFLTSIAAFFFFSLFAYSIGFSIVIGAYIAGLGLASLPYNFDIEGQVRPLRDFFATLFFVSLGMQIVFTNFLNILIPLIILTLFVIILKPTIITFLTSLFGYKKRTSFLTGISLGQISEYSLIIAAQGLILGHISDNFFSLTVLTAVTTMAVTPYFIRDSKNIYRKLSPHLKFMEKHPQHKEDLEYKKEPHYDIILFGCHRLGSVILNRLLKLKYKALVIDYDPSIIKDLMNEKKDCMYGDIINDEILRKIDFKKTKAVILTVPDQKDSLFLLQYAKRKNPDVHIILTSSDIKEALELYDKKADYVIIPRVIAAEHLLPILKDIIKDRRKMNKIRDDHIHQLLSIKVYGD